MNPDELGPDGLPQNPLPVSPEDEQTTTNRLGDALGDTGDLVEGAVDGMDLLGEIGEGVAKVASVTADAIGSVAAGAAEVVGGAAEGIGAAAEGVGTAVGAAAEGCGSCSLALLLMLASVGAAVAAVLR